MRKRYLFRARTLVFMLIAAKIPGLTAGLFAAEFEPLIGRWQRPDGGYVLEIRGIATDGKAAVRYLNPRPINVTRAEASKVNSAFRIFVELRDTGYPGSTYTLAYEPKKDVLLGIYYQAAMRQSFTVVFERIQ